MSENLLSPAVMKEIDAAMENEEITAISDWRLQNNDDPTDEAAYRRTALKMGSHINKIIDEAIANIKSPPDKP